MGFLALGRLVGIPWVRRALRVASDSAGCGEGLIVVRAIPVGGPLPDVSGHVVEAVAVWREGLYGRKANVSVVASVLVREVALMRVGHPLSARAEIVAPDIRLAREAATGGELPLCFRREAFSG